MNEHDNTFNLTDSILRVFGIIGFFAAVISDLWCRRKCHLPSSIPAEIIIVVGTIFFGLTPCTHRSKFLTYLPNALFALIRKPVANREYCQISENARATRQQVVVWRSYLVLYVP